MVEVNFQKQILHKLENMEKRIGHIIEFIEDSKLSEDDKKSLQAALKEEKEKKLLSKKQVFG